MKRNKFIILFILVLVIIIGIFIERYYTVKKLELIVKEYSFFEELPKPKLSKYECYRNQGKQDECRALFYRIEDKELISKIKNNRDLKEYIVPLDPIVVERIFKEDIEYFRAESKIKEEWDINVIQEEDVYNMYVF